MNSFWERFFYLFSFISQGSSFLSPRAYAVIHRMDQSYNDTHHHWYLPPFVRNFWALVIRTKNVYLDYLEFQIDAEIAFGQKYPKWTIIDRISDMWFTRFVFVGLYIAFYVHFAAYWWMFLLLPIHFLMGPIHGAIITWCKNKYPRSARSKEKQLMNFNTENIANQRDKTKTSASISFAKLWIEFDPTAPVIKILHTLHIVQPVKA